MSAQKDIVEKINDLRQKRGALILAHNYQLAEVQAIADHVGDSLELSRIAAENDTAELVLFCGVFFMAETAVLLKPQRPVYLPDPHADCPMARMVNLRQVLQLKAEHPGALVVSYVNTTAEVKAQSDICCTSANAKSVVENIPAEQEIIFLPDRNLGGWIQETTGRENMIIWNGFCPTHNRILLEHVVAARSEHPGAPVVVHPECRPEVRATADEIASTGGMVRFAGETSANEIIVGTEIGMLDRLRSDYPDKSFYPVTELADCPNMKLTTLEKILWELEDLANPVLLEADLIAAARKPIEKMVEVLGS